MTENEAKWKGFVYSAYHGKNECGEPIYKNAIVYRCSNCDRRIVIQEDFCPSCGRKMRKE